MTVPRIAPYGSWRSPITAELIVARSVPLGHPQPDGDDVYWTEGRPAEGGRYVVVRRTPDGRINQVTPAGFNVRTRVHEYGGLSFLVDRGTVYFANFADQRLYRQDPGAEPRPLTPGDGESAALRYAGYVLDAARSRLICVREDHRDAGHEATNTLVAVSLEHEDAGQVLAAGYNFYASTCLSPDGTRLAWLCWNHPNMPWDGCELWLAEIAADGSLGRRELVAGGPDESIFQPTWSPDGRLYFVSDRTGWWNLYRHSSGEIEALCKLDAEFGKPQWGFGMSTYAFVDAGRLICAYTQDGAWRLAYLDLAAGRLEPIALPYSDLDDVVAADGRAVFIASGPTDPTSVVQVAFAGSRVTVLRRANDLVLDAGYLALPQQVAFPTTGGLTAYGIFYLPTNQDYVAPPGELPPLLVMIHGGPTGATSTGLDLGIQFWSSRGIAVLDVNYGGSTGYGRPYRERLKGSWGVVDVDDCVNGARYLSAQGLVDGRRLAITGGSAGGYTTLAALTFTDVFGAGASYYGIGDLAAMAADTHKFESRYLDSLVGPYPAARDLYEARSPLHHVERLARPVILLQGLEDRVVPPQQAEMMYQAVLAKGVPVAYLPFAGEQHGFRRAETIKRALEAELFFYSRIFGFQPADAIEPVPIANLPAGA